MTLKNPGMWSVLLFASCCALVGAAFHFNRPDADKFMAALIGLAVAYLSIGPFAPKGSSDKDPPV
jgi:hypothetical protein